MTHSQEPNVIKQDGLTFFRNTVVGMVDATGNLLTVSGMLQDFAHVIASHKNYAQQTEERLAAVCDAGRVLADEVTEFLAKPVSNTKELEGALLQFINNLAGCALPAEEPAKPSADSEAFGPTAEE